MSLQVKAPSGAACASGRGPSPLRVDRNEVAVSRLSALRGAVSRSQASRSQVSRSRVSRLAAVFFIAFSAFASIGCSSKLPGPAECERVALRASGIRTLDQLRFPHVRVAVENLTNECLTTPFDRETVRCMEEVGAFQICIRDFVLRHPERMRRTQMAP